MGWEAVTALSTAFTAGVILLTAIVGLVQLRQLSEQRRDTAAIELMHSLQDTTFARAFLLVISLPGEIPDSDAIEGSPQVREAELILAFRFETLGLLVYRGTISFEIVEDLVGGALIAIWHRLKDVTLRTREEKHWPAYCEWFQWLAEQMEKRGRLEQTPAHIRLRDWNVTRTAR